MTMKSISEMWESFRDATIPPTASQLQVDECRRSFYAGAWGMLCSFERMGDDDVSEASGIDWLQARKAEGHEFLSSVSGSNSTSAQTHLQGDDDGTLDQ